MDEELLGAQVAQATAGKELEKRQTAAGRSGPTAVCSFAPGQPMESQDAIKLATSYTVNRLSGGG